MPNKTFYNEILIEHNLHPNISMICRMQISCWKG